MLRATDDPDLNVLHIDLDQSVTPEHPFGHEGRPDGSHATDVQSQSDQDAGCCGDNFCLVLAAVVCDIRAYQAGRRDRRVGGRGVEGRDTDRSVARLKQLLHQSHPLRFLQQKVSPRVCRDYEERPMLWQAALLRDGRSHVDLD